MIKSEVSGRANDTEGEKDAILKVVVNEVSIYKQRITSCGLIMTLETELQIAVEGTHRNALIMTKGPG